MKNLTIIHTTDFEQIKEKMPRTGAHFTNGTFAYEKHFIVPTVLTGFNHVNTTSKKGLPMVIAVNSDRSMMALGKQDFEDELTRANKVAIPLAEYFPQNKVFVIFYDEPTPFNLYKTLHKHNPALMHTLHKWGYGTDPTAPKIEGAEYFQTVYASPLPNDTKPVCYDNTDLPAPGEKQNIVVVDLRNQIIHPTPDTMLKRLTHFAYRHRYTLFIMGAMVTTSATVALLSSNHVEQETLTPMAQ